MDKNHWKYLISMLRGVHGSRESLQVGTVRKGGGGRQGGNRDTGGEVGREGGRSTYRRLCHPPAAMGASRGVGPTCPVLRLCLCSELWPAARLSPGEASVCACLPLRVHTCVCVHVQETVRTRRSGPGPSANSLNCISTFTCIYIQGLRVPCPPPTPSQQNKIS